MLNHSEQVQTAHMVARQAQSINQTIDFYGGSDGRQRSVGIVVKGHLPPPISGSSGIEPGSKLPAKKFNGDITDERSDHRDGKVGLGKNIFHSPNQAPPLRGTRVSKLPHQKIGIEKEDYKTNLGQGSPDVIIHSRTP
jgi:hypothetical protein